MRVARHGVAAELPAGWEARIYRRETEVSAAGEPLGTRHPVLHAGTFPLPVDRGDYGSDAVDVMGADDVFVSLVEFDPEAAGTALFARDGVPWPLPATAFNPRQLQRRIVGQAGAQFFFHTRGRAYCLYVVLGRDTERAALVDRVNELLAGVEIDALAEDDS